MPKLHPSLTMYDDFSRDIETIFNGHDTAALKRVQVAIGKSASVEELRHQIKRRMTRPVESITRQEARELIARLSGFVTWDRMATSLIQGSVAPPFYFIQRKGPFIEAQPPMTMREWNELLEVATHHRIHEIRCGGHWAQGLGSKLIALDFVTSLHLENCEISDEELLGLARMPQLQKLNLSGCRISDSALKVLEHLPALREFTACWAPHITDAGTESLTKCEWLERVDVMGTGCGDGLIAHLAGKQHLRHVKSGQKVSDSGLQLLHHIPAFKNWKDEPEEITLMGFEARPTYLLLQGEITDEGLASLKGLDGLFALNLDNSKLGVTSRGIEELNELPQLGWLGFDARDESMSAIAKLPQLRFLMCQDTSAGDAGFTALSRSETIEYIWGRRCHNLSDAGFTALSSMKSLRGLSVSCKNVTGKALALLPAFPMLKELMPIDFKDPDFRYIGMCGRLEAIWCMYCRDTGDAATEHISGLRNLASYYAGSSQITDKSLELLSAMNSLEQVTLFNCAGVTDYGVEHLARLPKLKDLTLETMPNVNRECLARFGKEVNATMTR